MAGELLAPTSRWDPLLLPPSSQQYLKSRSALGWKCSMGVVCTRRKLRTGGGGVPLNTRTMPAGKVMVSSPVTRARQLGERGGDWALAQGSAGTSSSPLSWGSLGLQKQQGPGYTPTSSRCIPACIEIQAPGRSNAGLRRQEQLLPWFSFPLGRQEAHSKNLALELSSCWVWGLTLSSSLWFDVKFFSSGHHRRRPLAPQFTLHPPPPRPGLRSSCLRVEASTLWQQ